MSAALLGHPHTSSSSAWRRRPGSPSPSSCGVRRSLREFSSGSSLIFWAGSTPGPSQPCSWPPGPEGDIWASVFRCVDGRGAEGKAGRQGQRLLGLRTVGVSGSGRGAASQWEEWAQQATTCFWKWADWHASMPDPPLWLLLYCNSGVEEQLQQRPYDRQNLKSILSGFLQKTFAYIWDKAEDCLWLRDSGARKQARKNWVRQSDYEKDLIGEALGRGEDCGKLESM